MTHNTFTLTTLWRRTSKLLLVAGLLAGFGTGWVAGQASTPRNDDCQQVIVPETSISGEKMPTIMLDEQTITASRKY